MATDVTVNSVDEILPGPKLFTLGLQHVLVMYAGAIAVPLIVGRVLGLTPDARFGDQDLGCAAPAAFADGQAFADHVARSLGRAVTWVPPEGAAAQRSIRRVAWCTGGAQGYFEAAIAAGADVFVTGEISEPQAHLARETGVGFIAAGHHATERYGAPAVAAQVAQQWGLAHEFIEIDNPA